MRYRRDSNLPPRRGQKHDEKTAMRGQRKRIPPVSPTSARVAAEAKSRPADQPTTKRPYVANVGRWGGTRGGRHLLAANRPRSVLMKRASFPLVEISRKMAL